MNSRVFKLAQEILSLPKTKVTSASAASDQLLSGPLLESAPSSEDPKWVDLFIETFIRDTDSPASQPLSSGMDDLLFFVRVPHSNNSDQPVVFVRRKVRNQVPELDDIIAWRETFFLNVISQLHYKMNVSVCERRLVPIDYQDLPFSMESVRPDMIAAAAAASPESTGETKRAMIPQKVISKSVYSSPHKSRMDKKTAGTELSYPTIYFCVDDFEDAFDGINVRAGQYLCVELSVEIEIGLKQPQRISLFQGAVPFTSLMETYQVKQLPTPFKALQKLSKSLQQTFLSVTTGAGGDAKSQRFSSEDDDRQYVMMRGPNGKGHAQVAIKPAEVRSSVQSPVKTAQSNVSITSSTLSFPEEASATSSQGSFSDVANLKHKSSSLVTAVANAEVLTKSPSDGIKTENVNEGSQTDEPALACLMTYIHLPWYSIINDVFCKAGNK